MLTSNSSVFRLSKVNDPDYVVFIKPTSQVSPYHYISSDGYLYDVGARYDKTKFLITRVMDYDDGVRPDRLINKEFSHWNYVLRQRSAAWAFYSDVHSIELTWHPNGKILCLDAYCYACDTEKSYTLPKQCQKLITFEEIIEYERKIIKSLDNLGCEHAEHYLDILGEGGNPVHLLLDNPSLYLFPWAHDTKSVHSFLLSRFTEL